MLSLNLGTRAPSNRSEPSGAPSRGPSAWLHVVPLAIYFLLALAMTYPLITVLKTHIGGATGDCLEFIWNLWWVKKALLDPHLSLFYTNYLYYPTGVSLAFHTLSILNGVLSIPLQPVLGVVGAYNVMVLSGFVIGSWGAYFLAYELTRHRVASVFAGIAFGFCPYHFANAMADLNIASIQFVPFTFLFLIRWRRRGGYREPVLAGLFLGLTGLCCWYYLLFVSMAAALLGLVWFLGSKGRRVARSTLVELALFAAVTGLVISPAVVPMVKASLELDFPNPGRQEAYSADLLAYVLPSSHQPLFGERVKPLYDRMAGNIYENTVTPGLLLIGLAVYGAWGRRKLRDEDRRTWVVLGLGAFVLSLGPTLECAGRTFGASGYLPYRWLVQSVPGVSQARVASRFAMLVALSASVLAAYGFRDLLERRRIGARAWRRVGIGAVLFTVLLAEFWIDRYPALPIRIPAFFREVAEDGGDYAILGLPFRGWDETVLAEYYQTAHGKRIVNGLVSRTPVGADAMFDQWEKAPGDYAFLVENRVRYIVLLAPKGITPWHRGMVETLSGIPWLSRVETEDAKIVVYAVRGPGGADLRR